MTTSPVAPNGRHAKTPAPDCQPPHSGQAENGFLGSVLIDPELLLLVRDKLQPEDFYIEKNCWIYEAMLRLHAAGVKIDLLTLSDDLEKHGQLDEIGGRADLTGLITATPTSLHGEYYARLIIEAADRRRLIDAATRIVQVAFDQTTEAPAAQAEKLLQEALTGRSVESITPAKGVMDHTFDHLELVHKNKGITGIPTGLEKLDQQLGGLQRSDLIIIAGRPGMGKTAFSTQLVLNAAARGYRCLIFSLEMSKLQLGQRMVSINSNVDVYRLKNGQIADAEWSAIISAVAEISKLPFAVDDSSDISPGAIRSRAVRHWVRSGVDLVVIDYLQITGRDGDRRHYNMHQEMAEASRQFKTLARELDIPVILLSQLNRAVESNSDKRPQLANLRESGAIEETADVVLLLYRPGYYDPDTQYPNLAEINIAKHRSGPLGPVPVYFKKELTQFKDLTEERSPP